MSFNEPTNAEPDAGVAVLDRPAEPQVDDRPWVCIVWDDPVNLFSYVIGVFVKYFHYPLEKATALTFEVDRTGKAIVNSGSREEMERDCNAMHSYGLWATIDRAE